MPKVTSHSSIANKENEAPTMANYARRRRKGIDDDAVHDEPGRLASSSHVGATTALSRLAKQRNESSSSALALEKEVAMSLMADRDAAGLEQYEYRKTRGGTSTDARDTGEAVDSKVATWQLSEERAARERDEIQSQYDTLRELRMTEPEKMMMEWKRDAETKDQRAKDYIAALKKELKELKTTRDSPSDASAGFAEGDNELRRQLTDSLRREEKLKDDNARLMRDLEKSRLQVSSATMSQTFRPGFGSGQLGAGDERAVRRLYEDLTGIVVNNVESMDGHEGFRRFHAIFACAGYYDLEIKLEESASDLPSIVPSSTTASRLREDLVYTPAFDDDRDADLLQSGRLPSFLRDSIRFERATAVKFMATLHKKLDRNSKR